MLLKLIFSILILNVQIVAQEHHYVVETSDSLYGEISLDLDSLVSFETITAYDRNGTECGLITFMWEKPMNKCNIDRSDQIIDISDLIYLLDYMFRGGKL